jgi:hypothetical protein
VFLATGADGATITWCNVRAFDTAQTVTAQAVLLPDGSVEYHYASNVGIKDAVVGIAPGHSGQFQPVDLSTTGQVSSSVAIGERFSGQSDVDLVALAKHFYQTHPDNYDQLMIFTDTSVVSGNTFSYESTVANEIRGIGVDIYNSSADFGSAGRLRSVVMMDTLSKFPDNPTQKFLGENNTLSVMGQRPVTAGWRSCSSGTPTAGPRVRCWAGISHWSFFQLGSVGHGRQQDRRPRRRRVQDRGRGERTRWTSMRDGTAVAVAGAGLLLRGLADQHRAAA